MGPWRVTGHSRERFGSMIFHECAGDRPDGKADGRNKYYDEACRQVLNFAKRMFNKEKGVFYHGWVEGMTEHPEFYWARANGWAFMTEVELLEVLPEKPSVAAGNSATTQSTCKRSGSLSIGIGILASVAGPAGLLSGNIGDRDLHLRTCARYQSWLD